MQLQEMFVKPIDRTLQGVVVVGDNDKADVKQELEEYVVTKELAKHFAELFENYKTGITGTTKQNGVWISGFFGSGKSHFLKMVSYLLENSEVAGKKAIEYFEEDNKIKDATVLADIKLAAETPTDVILFNIDSKADQTAKQSKDALVNVFLKVFNDMQGFYGTMPYLAELEKHLTDEGKFDQFKEKFEEIFGRPWEQARTRFDFIQDDVVDALVDIGFMSENAARNFCERAIQDYQISIEEFANRVNDYIKSQGKNHHVVFLVDEVGQYIGDDSQLMLNLQTIREELGKKTQGKAWIIVTSQQDIDSITKVKGNDFSKIQGRFDTRLSLTSSNVDEVIKERILKKNEVASDTLKALYDNRETTIKSKIRFSEGTPEMKLYSSAEDFAQVYPFVPYQFNLLGNVLNSIRTHGASGKHLSEGERSMLSLFKESAEAIKDSEVGSIVPFYRFYDALENFLDAAHSRVIKQALENKNINPNGEADNFNVNVLKVLFLIKYVKELENSNLENITTLMISDIDEDRLALQQKVEEALAILERETLIQRNQRNYIFLTEEEQEIGREIDNIDISLSETSNEIAKIIFDDLYSDSRFKHPNKELGGRYTFGLNRYVDNINYKSARDSNVGIRVITPYDIDFPNDIRSLSAQSLHYNDIFVILPENNEDYVDELTKALKIENYARTKGTTSLERYREILEKKQAEARDRRAMSREYLIDALKDSIIFVKGKEISKSRGDIKEKFNRALEELINTTYPRLSYINKSFIKDDIITMLANNENIEIQGFGESEFNKEAQDMILYDITQRSDSNTKISLRSIIDKYQNPPYGFLPEDTIWIIARLFKKNEIQPILNSQKIVLSSSSPQALADILTNRRNTERLVFQVKKHIPEKDLKEARLLLRQEFGIPAHNLNEDELRNELEAKLEVRKAQLESLRNKTLNGTYPGREVIEQGLNLIAALKRQNENSDFYKRLNDDIEDWEDFLDDIKQINTFYKKDSNQFKHFENALKILKIYDDGRNFSSDSKLEELEDEINKILKNKTPFSLIPKLPELIEKFRESYSELLDKNSDEVSKIIKEDQDYILSILDEKSYRNDYYDKYASLFKNLIDELPEQNSVINILGYKNRSQNIRDELFRLMQNRDKALIEEARKKEEERIKAQNQNNQIQQATEAAEVIEEKPRPVITQRKTINIRDLFSSKRYHTFRTEEEINDFVKTLSEQLKRELNSDENIIIDFNI